MSPAPQEDPGIPPPCGASGRLAGEHGHPDGCHHGSAHRGGVLRWLHSPHGVWGPPFLPGPFGGWLRVACGWGHSG